MMSFLNIEFDRPLSPDEFMALSQHPVVKAPDGIFGCIPGIFELLNGLYVLGADIPTMRIKESEIVNSYAAYSRIYITKGLVLYILETKFPCLEGIMENASFKSIAQDYFLPQCMMAWVLGHEYVHMFRKHTDVSVGDNSIGAAKAMEMDADLCAIAAIYRHLQLRFQPEIAMQIWTDLEIRKLAAYIAFCTIRRLPDPADALHSHHPPMYMRLYFMLNKLATIAEKNGEAPDNDWSNESSLHILQKLINFVLRCELGFQKIYGDINFGNLMEQIKNIPVDDSSFVVDKWHEIRSDLSSISKTVA